MATLGDITLTVDSEIHVAADGESLLVDGSPFPIEDFLDSVDGEDNDFRLRVCQNAIMGIRASARTPDPMITLLHDYIIGDRHLDDHLQAQIKAYVYPRDITDPERPVRDRAFLFLYHQHQRHLRRVGPTVASATFGQTAAIRKNELRRALYGSVNTDRAKAFIKSPFPLYVTRQQIPPEIRQQAIFILDTERFREASRIDPSLAQDILAIQHTTGVQRLNSYEVTRREELRFKLQLALGGLSNVTIEDWRDRDWIEFYREDISEATDDEQSSQNDDDG